MDNWIDDNQPCTTTILNFINEAMLYGPIKGIILPRNWVINLSEENPAWRLDPQATVFMMNSIMIKVNPYPSNTLFAELVDSRTKIFDAFKV